MDFAFNSALTKDDINRLPLYRYTGNTMLVRDEAEFADAMRSLATEKILGFDTETKPVFRKGKTHAPSLIQLATAERVFIFQLAKIPLGKCLAAILADPAIIKTGVAIADDIRALQALYAFEPAGLVDLSQMARKNNIGVYSLRGLAACFIGVRISKSERCSNWSAAALSGRQMVYAATDAWISREIYMRANAKGFI